MESVERITLKRKTELYHIPSGTLFLVIPFSGWRKKWKTVNGNAGQYGLSRVVGEMIKKEPFP